jgi:hypothetical protein
VLFYSPSDRAVGGTLSVEPPATSASGSFSVVFNQFSEAGTWTLNNLSVGDALGNIRGYNAADLQALGFPTQLINSNTIDVSIDIMPGSLRNRINPRSTSLIPVAILTTPAFDAATVDPGSVRFGVTGTEAAAARSALQDADDDGDVDLLLGFPTRRTGIRCGATSARLTGLTVGGQPIQGSDSIVTVGC